MLSLVFSVRSLPAVVVVACLVACGACGSSEPSFVGALADGGAPADTDASGAAASSTMRAPLDAGERGDAASADASGDASAETGCHCADVSVACNGGGSMYATTDRVTCTVALPPAICALFDLSLGARVDPRTMLERPAPPDLDADQIFDFCAGKHEASHACDAPSVTSCATEARAYRVTVACMTAELPALCAKDAGECSRLSLYVDAGRAAGELNDCLCGGASCPTCTKQCHDAHADVPTTCEAAGASYCPAS